VVGHARLLPAVGSTETDHRTSAKVAIIWRMVDALKDSFGPDVPERIGAMLAAADPTFDVAMFLARVLEG